MNISTIDETTFPAIYRAYAGKMEGYMQKHGIPLEDVPDCCQNAWMTCWSYRHKFDPAKGPLNTYIFLQAQASVSWFFRQKNSQMKYLGRNIPMGEDYSFRDSDDPVAARKAVPTDAQAGWPWPMKFQRSSEVREPRTHCKHGHDWIPANIAIYKHGKKYCKRCAVERQTKYFQHKRIKSNKN